MKKSTQKMLMALGIIMIFGLSSIAFVFSGFTAPSQRNDIKPLDKFIIDGEIDQRVENAYVQGGFTFLKLYYNTSASSDIISFVEQAPSALTTPDGQMEIIAQKIASPTNYVRIVNINGEEYISNATIDKIFETLCVMLVIQPTECALNALNISS